MSVSSTLDWPKQVDSLTPAIIEACSQALVAAGPGALVREIGKRLPELHFRQTLSRGGWYRLGGVLDSSGKHISQDLESWASERLADCGDDLGALAEELREEGVVATRLLGCTHYLVASVGEGTDDYLQLELEDLQEIRSHVLGEGDAPPATLDELLVPGHAAPETVPVGLPCYRFRRLTHVGNMLKGMLDKRPEPQPIHRFLSDWQAGSAGQATSFSNHWVLAVREYLDRYRQNQVHVQVVPALNGDAPRFGASQGTMQLALRDALQAFDRQAGYPFAWFFHMLTTKAVPHWVVASVLEDNAEGFAYLPGRDLAILRQWLHRPYSF